jgi:hypothetical protein
MIREYGTALAVVRETFDRIASGAYAEKGGKQIKITPPSFVEIVLLPALEKLAGGLPQYDVEVPAKESVEPDDRGYFRLRVSGQTVAGVNFGGADAKFIKVTLFPSGRPWGNPLHVDSMTRLQEIVEMVIRIAGIPQKKTDAA